MYRQDEWSSENFSNKSWGRLPSSGEMSEAPWNFPGWEKHLSISTNKVFANQVFANHMHVSRGKQVEVASISSLPPPPTTSILTYHFPWPVAPTVLSSTHFDCIFTWTYKLLTFAPHCGHWFFAVVHGIQDSTVTAIRMNTKPSHM